MKCICYKPNFLGVQEKRQHVCCQHGRELKPLKVFKPRVRYEFTITSAGSIHKLIIDVAAIVTDGRSVYLMLIRCEAELLITGIARNGGVMIEKNIRVHTLLIGDIDHVLQTKY